jgi:hypothetical protein
MSNIKLENCMMTGDKMAYVLLIGKLQLEAIPFFEIIRLRVARQIRFYHDP